MTTQQKKRKHFKVNANKLAHRKSEDPDANATAKIW